MIAMSKKSFMAAIAISLILILFSAGLLVVEVAKANPFSFFWTHIDPIPGTIPPTITVFSPQNNTQYTSKNIIFSFNISKPQAPIPVDDGISRVRYSLDDINYSNSKSLYECTIFTQGHIGIPEFSYSNNLTLPDGNHSITVYSEGTVTQPDNMTVFWVRSNSTVYFTIDTTPPAISNLSIEAKTYRTADIPISFCINETSQISYRIDNQAEVAISGNTTLTGLPEGYHNLIIYARDAAGNIGRSNYVVFNVNTQPSPTPNSIKENSTLTIIILGLVLAVVVVGLLVYFSKHKGWK